MTDQTLALIVASPGRIRDSWQALLKAVPRIQAIELADDLPSALPLIAAHWPALVLLDAKLTDHIQETLSRIKARSPQTRCIVLAGTFAQQWQAKQAEADSVLLAGTPADMLFAAVEGVLSWPHVSISAKPDHNDKRAL